MQRHIASIGKVFVVGCAKSGTTWLMNLLNGHPHVVVRGEGRFGWRLLPFLQQSVSAFNKDQAKYAPGDDLQIRDIDLLMASRLLVDTQLWKYIETSGKQPTSVRVVGDKTPQHATCMPLLHGLYPEARFIHIIRDPRDVATSAWHHFGKTDVRSQSEYFRHFMEEVWPASIAPARQFAAAHADKYLEIRYEDLHQDETGHLKKCLHFIGVDAAESSVSACLEAGSFSRRSGGRERGEKDDTAFYRKGIVGDYQNHLTAELESSLTSRISRLMAECGYLAAATRVPAA